MMGISCPGTGAPAAPVWQDPANASRPSSRWHPALAADQEEAMVWLVVPWTVLAGLLLVVLDLHPLWLTVLVLAPLAVWFLLVLPVREWLRWRRVFR